MVSEAKMMIEHESKAARQEELQNEISALKYHLSMGEEKVKDILSRHKQRMH